MNVSLFSLFQKKQDLSVYRIARLTVPCPSHKNFNLKTLTFCPL